MSRCVKIVVILLFTILFGSTTIISQNTEDKIALSQAILQIESHYNITVNYDSALLQSYQVQPLDFSKDYSLIFAEISTQIPIVFTALNEGYYYISLIKDATICGYIREDGTNLSIAGATVNLGENYTISDANGFFTLERSQTSNVLTIKHLGYSSLHFKISEEKKCAFFYLKESAELLEQISLKAYIVDGIDLSASGKTEINTEEFSLLPGLIENDILHTTQALPQVFSINETTSNVNIRGGSNDQNLVTWDAIKMYQTGHFFGLISNFNPQITNQAVVTTNGSEASMTDGVSGTIALLTDTSITEEFTGSVHLNLLNADTFFDIPVTKDGSLQLAARKSLNDFFQSPTYNSYFDRISQDTEVENNENGIINTDKEFQFYDVSLRYLHNLSDKDQLRVNFIVSDNDLTFKENGIINNETRERNSSVSQQNIGAGVFYKHNFSDKTDASFQIYETDYLLRAENANVVNQQRFLQENKVSETGVATQLNYKLNPLATLETGYQFTETEITNLNDIDNPRFLRLISNVLRKHAVFAQSEINLKKGLRVRSGLRANYLEKLNQIIIEPRFIVTYQPGESWTYKLKGEAKHQTTTQIINFQNDFLGIEKRRWQLANDSTVPVLKSKQISTGFLVNKNKWLLDVELFYKEIQSITSQSQGFQTKYTFTQTVGDYKVYGSEFLVRHRGKHITSWLSYAFMNNTYFFNELPEKSFPSNYDIRHQLTLGSTYTNDRLKIAAGVNWRPGAPTTEPLEEQAIINEIQFKDANSSRLPDYTRVDVSAMYTLFNTESFGCETGFSFWNILNQKNRISSFYRIEDNEVKRVDQNALDLTGNAVIRFLF